ncbi:MAG: large protein [Dactylosporangium sp.]|jgi:hypothetical protein|nr:large protein [Dactylosporangium sp.]
MHMNRRVNLLSAPPRRAFNALVKLIVVCVLTATAGITAVVVSAAPAWASHFRAAQLSWSRPATTSPVVTLEMTASFRRNYNAWAFYASTGGGTKLQPNVGDVIQDSGTRLIFGDGATTIPFLLVTAMDAANNVLTVEAVNSSSPTSGHLQHTYPNSGGSWSASVSSCCRLSASSGHMNNPDGSTQITSLVNLGSGSLSSVSSSLPPIVDCPRNSPCNFTIPASLPAGATASYRLSNVSDAGQFVQPTGAAVSSSGLFTWNTTGLRLASAPLDTYYSAQVTITAANSRGPASSVAVDFFLRITNQANNAPTWVTPTVADGTIIDATPGNPVTITVAVSDPDSRDTLTLGVLNKPAGAAFTTSGTNPATGAFTWTPTAVGNTVLNFTAADQFGLQAVQRSVTVSATKKSPTLLWPTPTSIVYGTALDATQLDATLSTADGANTPPHQGTLTYAPAAGTILDGGDNTLSVTWTPDAADAVGWSSVTGTLTLHVNQAGQTLSFAPPIDDTVTHAYGDAPFPSTAVSSAGLPVTYSVGAGDACSSSPQADGSTQVAITGAGSCTLAADQPGNANYSAAQTLSHSFSFAKQTPKLSLSPNDTTYGSALGAAQLNATLTPSDATSHGSIAYTVDGGPLPADGIVPAGTHTLAATYTPDLTSGGNYNGVSVDATFTVAQAAQTINFGALAAKTVGDDAFPVTATASSGLPVAFSSATSAICTVTATGSVSVLHAGTCTIDADQSGDNNHLPASIVAQSFTVEQATQTINYTSPGERTYLDAPAALVASGGGSGNPVTFIAMPANVCTVNGTQLQINGAGDCTVTASLAGNPDYKAASDVIDTITIHKATPTVSWSTPSAILYGAALDASELNATVQPAGVAGDFAYALVDGTIPALGAVLHASAAPQLLKVTFTPAEPDNANFTSATGQTTILVGKADQAISWTSVPTSASYGDAPFTVAATGGASGNPVVFSAAAGSSCSVSGATVTITGAGACVLNADQPGNDDYNPAPSSPKSLTVAKQTPTMSWNMPDHITYGTPLGGDQFNATVTPAEAAASGSVRYTTDAGSGDAAGQVLHAGSHPLTAAYTPNDSGAGPNYTSASTSVTLIVDQAPQAITDFAAIATQSYGGGPLTLTATGGGSGKPVYFTVAEGNSCTSTGTNGTTLTLNGVGNCTVIAHQDGTADYNPAPDVAQSFQIQPAAQTITFAPLPDVYVGDWFLTKLSATGGGSGNRVTFAAGPIRTCIAMPNGILIITGPGTCSVTASQAGNTNYAPATPVTRTFTVAYRVCVPSDRDQDSYHSGSTVTLKVSLCNAEGRRFGRSDIVLHATGVDGGPATAPGNSQPGNNFRYSDDDGGSYRYNVKSTGLAVGTHQFTFTITGDPTTHTIPVIIR